MAGNWLEGTKQKRRKERGNKDDQAKETKQKKQSRNGRQKRKTRENDKLRVVLKKGSWVGGGGGKRAKHLSNCRQKPLVCISYKSTPVEKHQNCRENGAFFLS